MSKDFETPITPAIACDLIAIETENLNQHLMTVKQLFALVQEVRDLPDGYALRLPNDTDTILQTARFIAHERQCCSFLSFALEVNAEIGPLWLNLTTGRAGAKQFLKAELGLHLDETPAQAAGLR
jgi:hypothetical protein